MFYRDGLYGYSELHQIVSFGKEDGFPDYAGNRQVQDFFMILRMNQLYLGYANAVIRFNPFDVLQEKIGTGMFLLRTWRSMARKTFNPPGNLIKIPGQTMRSWITIGSINFSDGNSQHFAYRIVKDTIVHGWNSAVSHRSAFPIFTRHISDTGKGIFAE